jgi:hypothetical protein
VKERIDGEREFWSAASHRMTAFIQQFKPSFPPTRLRLGMSVCALLFVLGSSPHAQSATKTLRLGILEPGNSTNVCEDGFRQSLKALGYVENQNLIIDARYAEFKPDRLMHLASELVQLKPHAWTDLSSCP